jgi:hypothetical protein
MILKITLHLRGYNYDKSPSGITRYTIKVIKKTYASHVLTDTCHF